MAKKNAKKNTTKLVVAEEAANVRAGSAGAVSTHFDFGTYIGSALTGGSLNPTNSGYQKTNGEK